MWRHPQFVLSCAQLSVHYTVLLAFDRFTYKITFISCHTHLHTTSPHAPCSNALGFAAVALSALLVISMLAVPSARLEQCPQATALCSFMRVYRTTSPRPSAPQRGIPMLTQAQTQFPLSPMATSSIKWGITDLLRWATPMSGYCSTITPSATSSV